MDTKPTGDRGDVGWLSGLAGWLAWLFADSVVSPLAGRIGAEF